MTTPSQNQPNPYAPPQAEVRDAVAPDEIELAGRGTRFGAALLDGIIGFLFVTPVFIGADFKAMGSDNFFNSLSLLGAVLGVVGLVALLGITAYLVHRNGQTIGKKLLGIKVVRTDYSRASLARIFWLRNVVNGIPGAIPFVGNIYGVVDHLFIFNERRQCVHDKIADTLVVKA